MRRATLIPLSLLLVSASPYDERRPVEELTGVERAFAASAQSIGVWQAFAKYIADDGVIFRPGPVNGKAWLREAGDYPGNLTWWPTFVEVSCDGRLGWSTGPVVVDKRIISHYVTIWGREEGRDWRLVLDYGNPHRPLPIERSPMEPARSVSHACGNVPARPAGAVRQELFAADDALSARIAGDNRAAYRASLAAQARLHRWGQPPYLGREAALAALQSEPKTYVTARLGGGAAASGDLGYTYGDAAWHEPERGDQKGYYLRVWRRERGRWKLALDEIRPITPPPRPTG